MGSCVASAFQAEGEKKQKTGVRMKRSILATGTDHRHIGDTPVASGVFDSTATTDGEITAVGSR